MAQNQKDSKGGKTDDATADKKPAAKKVPKRDGSMADHSGGNNGKQGGGRKGHH